MPITTKIGNISGQQQIEHKFFIEVYSGYCIEQIEGEHNYVLTLTYEEGALNDVETDPDLICEYQWIACEDDRTENSIQRPKLYVCSKRAYKEPCFETYEGSLSQKKQPFYGDNLLECAQLYMFIEKYFENVLLPLAQQESDFR